MLMETPAVVLIDPKYPHNVGATIRACSCFDIKSLVWTGERVNPAKYERLPREERMKGYKRVDFRNHQRPFDLFAKDSVPVCVEVFESSEPLTLFDMLCTSLAPRTAEFPQVVRRLCHRFVHIPAHFCLNLSAAVNVVLAHRLMSRQLAGKQPILPLREMLYETAERDVPTPAMEQLGWDGK
jgi:tRNA(Leu) C34 or U34 (ribose-2'-O)-methylase TrmL